ncbi:MAG: hypothetical protein ACFFCM_20855 [Promethearchaeota archaeon]
MVQKSLCGTLKDEPFFYGKNLLKFQPYWQEIGRYGGSQMRNRPDKWI